MQKRAALSSVNMQSTEAGERGDKEKGSREEHSVRMYSHTLRNYSEVQRGSACPISARQGVDQKPLDEIFWWNSPPPPKPRSQRFKEALGCQCKNYMSQEYSLVTLRYRRPLKQVRDRHFRRERPENKMRTVIYLFYIFFKPLWCGRKGWAMGAQDGINEKRILSSWGFQSRAEGRWGERMSPTIIHKSDKLIRGRRGTWHPQRNVGSLTWSEVPKRAPPKWSQVSRDVGGQ